MGARSQRPRGAPPDHAARDVEQLEHCIPGRRNIEVDQRSGLGWIVGYHAKRSAVRGTGWVRLLILGLVVTEVERVQRRLAEIETTRAHLAGSDIEAVAFGIKGEVRLPAWIRQAPKTRGGPWGGGSGQGSVPRGEDTHRFPASSDVRRRIARGSEASRAGE